MLYSTAWQPNTHAPLVPHRTTHPPFVPHRTTHPPFVPRAVRYVSTAAYAPRPVAAVCSARTGHLVAGA
eukprot:1118374-Rhodomonas_salina.3